MNELALKYGCNPNQKPSRIYMEDGSDLPVTVLNGKPGYINFLDALNSIQLVKELKTACGLPAAASFKHVSPAGAALGLPLTEVERRMYHIAPETELSPLACAYARARGADRMSSFGDWIALSDICDVPTAKLIQHEVSDGIIAPGYEPEALKILASKKKGNYNVVAIDPNYKPAPIEHKQVYGITFEQGRNELEINADTMLTNWVTENKDVTDEQNCPYHPEVHPVQQRVLHLPRPDHRRGRRPAEPHPLHPSGGPEGRQLAAAPHGQGAEPALPRRCGKAQPRQRH